MSHPAAIKNLPVNLIYEAPSIQRLAQIILIAVHTPISRAEKDKDNKTREMLQKVEEYSKGFPTRSRAVTSNDVADGEEVVLVTGTTSGLGCDILAHLLADSSVVRVYAFNRQSSDVRKRQLEGFKARDLPESLLSSSKYRPVEGDTSVSGLCIDAALFDEVSGLRPPLC